MELIITKLLEEKKKFISKSYSLAFTRLFKQVNWYFTRLLRKSTYTSIKNRNQNHGLEEILLLIKTVVKLSRILLTITGIGITTIALGILYFSGLASSDRLFYGFDYKILLSFGFFFGFVGLFPVLASMDTNMKKNVKKVYIHLLVIMGIGVVGIIYSFLVYGNYLSSFDPSHSWFDYLIITSFFLFFGFSPLIFAVENRERLWSYKLVFILFIIIGFIFYILSGLVYGQYFDFGELLPILDVDWSVFFIAGSITIYLGLLPLMVTASQEFRDRIFKLRFLWVITSLIGFLLVILAPVIMYYELNVLGIEWTVILYTGALIEFISLFLFVGSDSVVSFLQKLRFLWILLLLLGILSVFISLILVQSTSIVMVDYLDIETLLGFTWEIYFAIGTVLTVSALILIGALLFYEAKDPSRVGTISTSSGMPEIDAKPNEMVIFLEIIQESNDQVIAKFKEAVREDKFRPRVYESLIKHYQTQNQSIKSRLSKLKKSISRTSGVESLFSAALEETPPPPPSTPPPSKPATIPSAPPIPPKTPPTTAPPPPSTTTPPAPSAIPRTPTPPPAPSGPSITTTSPSGQSPLDLIADARSTSIAELRGEMLKELRRLREIFKEE